MGKNTPMCIFHTPAHSRVKIRETFASTYVNLVTVVVDCRVELVVKEVVTKAAVEVGDGV